MKPADLSKLKIDRALATDGSPRRRRPLKAIAFAALTLAVAAGIGYRMLTAPQVVEATTVASAWPSQNYTLLNATGYVVPQRKASISSKAQGRLEWLGVLEGSLVKKDEVIARLESKDVRAAFEQAQAQERVARANLEQGLAELRDAESSLKRSEDLLAQKFISPAQHDTAVARFDKARAAVAGYRASISSAQANARVAQVAVEQTVIRAPFDAVVLTKNANVGDNITPFSSAADSKGAVITIADMSTLEVEADVSESSIGRITVGQPCEIQLDALPDTRLAGEVSRTVPTVDRAKATVLVKVKFVDRDPRVLPDMSAKVAFLSQPVPADQKTPLPAAQPGTVADRDGRKVVFRIDGDTVRAVPVSTGGTIGELVAIDGVEPGDRLVVKPDGKLRDGMRVTVTKG
jgi:HlyD family secretion protein